MLIGGRTPGGSSYEKYTTCYAAKLYTLSSGLGVGRHITQTLKFSYPNDYEKMYTVIKEEAQLVKIDYFLSLKFDNTFREDLCIWCVTLTATI